MRKKILLFTLLFCCFSRIWAIYTPITITSGFNADVIANGVGPAATSCVPLDESNSQTLVSLDWLPFAGADAGTVGLPLNGILSYGPLPGLNFQLADYSSNNALRLDSMNTSGSLNFTATGYGALYVLVGGTNADVNFSATIHFGDGSTQVVSNLKAPNWQVASANSITNIGAVYIPFDFVYSDIGIPGLFPVALNISSANLNKSITSISFNTSGINGYSSMGVFGVTGVSPCTGAPASANVLSTTTAACVGVSFALSLNTTYTDAGVGYQWQRSSDNNTWVSFPSGGTSATAAVTQTTATYYRCIISCAFGGQSTVSNSVHVTQNDPLDCYCIPTYSTSCGGSIFDTYINGILLNGEGGTSINNANTGCSTNSYVDYTSSVAPVNLIPTSTYNVIITPSNDAGDPTAAVWIDANDDGFFNNATELVGTTGIDIASTVAITIPLGAEGTHRMRIRTVWYYGAVTDACNMLGQGETEDYTVNFLPAPSCMYPTNITSTTTGSNSVHTTWSSTGAISYDYVLDQTNTTAPLSTAAITNTTTNAVDLSGLISGGEYYLHVKAHCSANDSSIWTSALVNIPDPCGATNLTIGVPFQGDNTNYANMTVPAVCNDNPGFGSQRTRLFKFTSPVTQTVKISTCGTTVSDYFRVLSGNCNTGYTCLGSSTDDANCTSLGQSKSVSVIAGTTYYVFWGGTGNFSKGPFTILVSDAPLAIALKSIDAVNKGTINQINWTTLTEKNEERFQLERSTDGNVFSAIATIKGNGAPSDYEYVDNDAKAGINYYRLKMTGIDGAEAISKTVQATVSQTPGMSLEAYPNPVAKALIVRVYGSRNGNVTLTDISGGIILQTKMNGSEMKINMSNLSGGVYLIRYADEHFSQVIKVNKE